MVPLKAGAPAPNRATARGLVHGFRVDKHFAAIGGQLETSVPPVEQGPSQHGFQTLQSPADGRMVHAQDTGGGRQAAPLRNFRKEAQIIPD